MSGIIRVDEIEKSSDTGTGIKLNSPLLNSSGTEIMSAAGALSSSVDMTNADLSNTTFPAGHILQVKRAFNNDAFSDVVTTSWQYIPNLSIDITPTTESSKFLIIANLTGGSDASASHNYMSLGIKRTAPVDVLVGQKLQVVTQDPYGYAVPHIVMSLDDPQTLSQITYKIGYNDDNAAGGTIYINQIYTGSYVYQSEMVVMEISQ